MGQTRRYLFPSTSWRSAFSAAFFFSAADNYNRVTAAISARRRGKEASYSLEYPWLVVCLSVVPELYLYL